MGIVIAMDHTATGKTTDGFKAGLAVLTILLGLLCSCSTTIEILEKGSPDRTVVVSRLDSFCKLTGLRRIGPIVECQKRTDSDGPAFYCRAYLQYDREPVAYHVNFNEDKRVIHFMPANMAPGRAIGRDTVKTPKRQQLLSAVRRVNATLSLGCFGQPRMQKTQGYYVVTFYSMPEHMLKEREPHQDPYISFLVTESGAVFGVFWGA
ncbi:hypothetical protein ACFLQU_03580 [Verrucomicrobiota bacterium]